MRNNKKKKILRPLTLMEVMIVIVLIGLIGGVIAYNMRGSLEEGKMFKTEQGGAQVYNILMLEVAKGNSIDTVAANWQEVIKSSPLVKKPDDVMTDGWSKVYEVRLSSSGDDILVSSARYVDLYRKKHPDAPSEIYLH